MAVIGIVVLAVLGCVRWALLVFRPWCRHWNVRCIHGDEIIAANLKRIRCLDCGRSLDGPIPDPCFYTGQAH
jgi:hypothetical protein